MIEKKLIEGRHEFMIKLDKIVKYNDRKSFNVDISKKNSM